MVKSCEKKTEEWQTSNRKLVLRNYITWVKFQGADKECQTLGHESIKMSIKKRTYVEGIREIVEVNI